MSEDAQRIAVCEQQGATWLPFRPLCAAKSGPQTHVSHEAVWLKEPHGRWEPDTPTPEDPDA